MIYELGVDRRLGMIMVSMFKPREVLETVLSVGIRWGGTSVLIQVKELMRYFEMD